MVTIKDIASAAGVSHGTVSNVLNKKGNVSAKKIKLVEEVALSMGYNLNKSAKSLRQGTTKNVAIVIPNIYIERYRDFYTGLSSKLEEGGYHPNLFISNDIMAKEKEIINRALSDRAHTIVLISCLDKEDNFYENKIFNETKLILIERTVKVKDKSACFYTFDSHQIGQDIGRHVSSQHYKNIVFFSNRRIFSFEQDIFTSLKKALNKDITLISHSCNTNMNLKKSFSITGDIEEADAIITTNTEKAMAIKDVLMYINKNHIPEIVTISSVSPYPSKEFVEYELNYQLFGNKIGASIIKRKESIIPKNDGIIYNYNSRSSIKLKNKLKIMCIEGSSSTALKDLAPLLKDISGIDYEVLTYTYSECFDMVSSGNISDDIDLIRVDMAWMSKIGKHIFSPFETLDYDFRSIFDKLLPGLDKRYSIIDGNKYALPFDPSIQMLFYRKDLFKSPVLSRLYYEKYKEELTTPSTFAQYNRIAAFFTEKLNSDSPTKHGTTVLTKGEQVVACQFLPYYKELGGEVVDRYNNISFDERLLEKALYHQLETLKYSTKGDSNFWNKSMEKFALGETAMATIFSNSSSQIANSKISKIIGKYGCAPLPNNSQLIGGGSIGIHNKSKNKTMACQFLEILYSKKIATLFAFIAGSSSNKDVYNNKELIKMYPWLSLVRESISKGKRRFKSNTMTEFELENALGKILVALLHGEISKDIALKKIKEL